MVTAERTLVLLRHAKSSWDDPVADHERALSVRGVRDAAAAGRLLVERGLRPDLVLCSTAVRTRQTWQRAVEAGADAGDVAFTDRIYEATAAELADVVAETPDRVGTLLLVGHGPGLPQLAVDLGGRPEPEADRARLERKFPTSGLAVLTAAGGWSGLRRLRWVSFDVPRG